MGFIGVLFLVRQEVNFRRVVLKEMCDDAVSNAGRAASNNVDL